MAKGQGRFWHLLECLRTACSLTILAQSCHSPTNHGFGTKRHPEIFARACPPSVTLQRRATERGFIWDGIPCGQTQGGGMPALTSVPPMRSSNSVQALFREPGPIDNLGSPATFFGSQAGPHVGVRQDGTCHQTVAMFSISSTSAPRLVHPRLDIFVCCCRSVADCCFAPLESTWARKSSRLRAVRRYFSVHTARVAGLCGTVDQRPSAAILGPSGCVRGVCVCVCGVRGVPGVCGVYSVAIVAQAQELP